MPVIIRTALVEHRQILALVARLPLIHEFLGRLVPAPSTGNEI